MLKFHHFRDFVAIAEARSIRGAARELGLAQPALSRSLRELENFLGVPLLERHTTGVLLTPAGERFLIRSRSALGEFQRGIDEMQNWGKDIGGRVFIALSSPPILALLPPVYQTFTKLYPKVRLHLMEATFPDAEPLLRDGRLDFYIGGLVGETVHRSFQRNLLFHNRRFVFARRGHPLMQAKTLKDLQNSMWLCGGLRQRPEQDLEELFQSHGLEAPTRITRVDSQMCMLVLMLNTDAIAMVPQQWAEAAVINELIFPIELTNDFPAPDVVLITRSGIPLTPSAEKLSDLFIRKANGLYNSG
ncbi:LysR family transcriptional regulator [Glaciimonas sp. PAMC28666]|uniref:LysR family transcriptional regulator n=1 Tax=Glaciimonas sp. PAMC28666 TaxID=2807626 RepID=UPI001964593E|nr:LysR substrate-binding domain-containing protein [Glaciimonas sp. PAMC28666]QRX81720.1 LysR family transcriptional regulator [Glaciimonas sp. PAMC28666]